MIEKLKIVFFAAYFLLAPLAGYYYGKEVWYKKVIARDYLIEKQWEFIDYWKDVAKSK